MKKFILVFAVVCCALLVIIGGYTPVSADDNTGSVTDIDGNVYQTVKIGNQVWMAENLRTTKYNDGSAIPLVTDDTAWKKLTTPGYCYYNNTTKKDSIKKYGALYNWYVVNTKKLAPKGWHVPTDAEWTTLENYLIANGYNWDGTTTDNKIAKSMAAKTDWKTYTDAGTIGNDLSKNNRSGFSALPGGFRVSSGYFFYIGYTGYWWCASEFFASHAFFRLLLYVNGNLYLNFILKSCGFSVRLLRDNASAEKALAQAGLLEAKAHFGLRLAYEKSGRYQEALEAFKQAIRLEPDLAAAHNNLGYFYNNGDTITDLDGNVYQTVKIGNQVWTVENLRTTKYNDGTPIPLVTDKIAWGALSTPGYCWYDNDIKNKSKYGALYNWFTVDTKKLAPKGWHVPTDAEWTTLENYLIANGYNWDGTATGNKIAKSMAAKTDWKTHANLVAIGNDLSKNNRSGFSALPGGYRGFSGFFYFIGDFGFWWGASEIDASAAYYRFLFCGIDSLYGDYDIKSCGFSVRLLRD